MIRRSLLLIAVLAAAAPSALPQNRRGVTPKTSFLTITSLNPNTAPAGSPSFTMVIDGDFASETISGVSWTFQNVTTNLKPTDSSATEVFVQIPASLLTTGGTAMVAVTIVQQPPTNSLPFTITVPPLTITSINPTIATAGGPAFGLNVNGTGFTSSTYITWNGAQLATILVVAGELSATVPASLIANPGTAAVDVAAPGQTSPSPFTFTIAPPPATLTSLNPPSAFAGGPAFTLTVNGAGFASGDIVTWNGGSLMTNFVSAAQLTAAVPANLIANVGTASVGLTVPGQVPPTPLSFAITQAPLALTSISPNTAIAGSPQLTLTANGSGFTSGAQVTWNGAGLLTSFISGTQLTATVPANLLANAGTASVSVSEANQTSPPSLPFTISPALTITSLSPSSTAAGGPSFTLTVNGTAFDSSTSILWNGQALSTLSLTSGQIMVTVPASFIAQAGSASINAKSSTQTSNTLPFTINPAQLTLTSISPNTAIAGGAAFTLTANGSGFTTSTQVTWNGATLNTGFVSANQLTASVPANLIAAVGSASVGVSAPGQTSPATLPFSITSTLTLTSLSPSSAAPGGASFILTINGTGFTSGTVALWNGQGLTTNVSSANLMTATVTANLISQTGTASVTAQNGNLVSNALTFTITNNPITLISLSPNSAPAGSATLTLTVNGSGFLAPTSTNFGVVPGTTVTWNGSGLTTQFVSTSQLTATVPASLLTTAGTAAVSVTGQPQPASLPFTITSPLTLTSISPSTVASGGVAFNLTANGSGFTASTSVTFNGNLLATTFISSAQLVAVVPATFIVSPGTASIDVTAGTGQQAPAALPLTITQGINLTSISPSSAPVGGPGFTLTVSGNGFTASTTVNWNGSPLATTFVSSTQLTATVSAGLIAAAGSAGVTASNGTLVSNSLTFSITSPGPVITSLVPPIAAAGGPAFTLTVNGTGFIPASIVAWNATNLVTTFVSGTQLTAAVPANLIAQVGTANVSVLNGGVRSNLVVFTITTPGPVITSISPASVTAAGPTFTLTVNGTGFVAGAVVSFNSTALVTTFVSGTQVTAGVPASLIALPGSAQITLANPSGPASNSVALTIAVPTPTITSISPASVVAGGPAFTLNVTGTGFLSGVTVSLGATGLTTTFVSGTQLTVAVPANLIAQPGTLQATAANAGGAASNAVPLTVTVPTPTITSISPASVVSGGAAFTLNVTGTGFLSGVTVSLGTTGLATTFVSGTQLTAAVPANLIAQPGTLQVTATNAGGSASNAVPLTITVPTPTITSISPASVAAGGAAFTLNVTGTGFLSGITVSLGTTGLATTFVSATQLTAAVPANLIAQPGTLQVTAANTGGAASNAVPLTVTATVPAITLISPAQVTQGGPAFTLTVVGNGFVSGATVFLGTTSLTTTFVSSTQLTAAVAANLIQQPASLSVTVTNPGTAASNALTLTVAPPPTITSISPSSVGAGGATFTLTVNGTNFLNSATVSLNSTSLNTTFVSATQVTAVVPANQITQPGTAQVTVANTSGAPSNAVMLTITPPAPTLTSISPATVTEGGPAFTLTVNGTNFVSGATVLLGTTSLTTTFVSATQLTAAVPANLIQQAGPIPVTATNPGTVASNPLPLTVTPPVPTITSISPSTITVGGPAFTLTVNGTNFLTGAVVLLNGNPLSSTVVSATQMTAQVPPDAIAQPGTVQITVANMGGTPSTAVTLTIAPVPATLTSLSPTSATAGSAAFTLTVNGTGFVTGAVVSFGTNALATTFVSATQVTAAVTAGVLLTPGTAQVVVQQGGTSSNALSFTINLPGPPSLRLNPPSTALPAQQPTIDFGLNSGYPLALSATVTLSFVSNATVPVVDPAIQFAGGGTTMSFTVPPNTTTLPALLISTGTVAGTITITVTLSVGGPLSAGGVNVTPSNNTATIVIAKAAPTILPGKVTVIRATGYLEVDITGFSTNRDMVQAVFQLNPVPNGSFTSSTFTIPLSALFTAWYQSAASTAFGSQFTYAQPFSVIGDTSQIQSVTVTLTNSTGASVSMTSN